MELKLIKKISLDTFLLSSMINLKDGRIAISIYSLSVQIINPKNDYHIDITINKGFKILVVLYQMSDEKLLISSNGYLYIFQLFEHSYNSEGFYELPFHVNHIIQLPGDRLLLCLWDYSIRIWNSISFKQMRMLRGHSNIITGIQLLTNNTLVSSSKDNTIRFWNISLYQCECIFDLNTESNILELANNKLLIAGKNHLYHIDLFSYKIETQSKVDSIIYSMIHLNNNNYNQLLIYTY